MLGLATVLVLLIAGVVGVVRLAGAFLGDPYVEQVGPGLVGPELGTDTALAGCVAESAKSDIDWNAVRGARAVRVVDSAVLSRHDDGSEYSVFPENWAFKEAWWTADGNLLVLRLGPQGNADAEMCFEALASTSTHLVINLGKEVVRALVLFPKFHDEVLVGNKLLSAAFDNVAAIDLPGADDAGVVSEAVAQRVAMPAPTTAQVDPFRMSQIWVGQRELVYGARQEPDGAGTLWRLRAETPVENLGPWAGDKFVDVTVNGPQALGVERDLFVCAIRSDTPVVYDSEAATLRRYPLPPEVAARGEVVATVAWLPNGSIVAATRPVPALEPGQDCPELDSNSDWVSTFRLDRASGTWVQDPTPSDEALLAIKWKMRPAG